MAIARNKKTTPDPAAIASFGAAAEAHVEPPASFAAPATRSSAAGGSPKRRRSAEGQAPKASLVRWGGEEELRDQLIEYARRERYNMQELMIEAMRLGIAQLDKS